MGFIGKARGHVEEQEIAWSKIKDVKCPLPPITVEWYHDEDGFSRPRFWVNGHMINVGMDHGVAMR